MVYQRHSRKQKQQTAEKKSKKQATTTTTELGVLKSLDYEGIPYLSPYLLLPARKSGSQIPNSTHFNFLANESAGGSVTKGPIQESGQGFRGIQRATQWIYAGTLYIRYP